MIEHPSAALDLRTPVHRTGCVFTEPGEIRALLERSAAGIFTPAVEGRPSLNPSIHRHDQDADCIYCYAALEGCTPPVPACRSVPAIASWREKANSIA